MSGRPPDHHTGDGATGALACEFVRDNLEAFVLGALDSADRETVELHLRWCPECRDEADALQRVASLLPLALSNGPAPSLGSSAALLERIAREDSERPAIGSLATAWPAPAPNAPVSPVAPSATAWRGFVPAALIAPLAIALLVVGAWANSMRHDLNDATGAMSTQAALGQTPIEGGEMLMFAVESPAGNAKGGGQIGLSESDLMGMAVAWDLDPETELEVWGVTYGGRHMKVCELYIDQTGAVMQTFSLPERPSSLRELYISDEFGEMMYMLRPQPHADGSPEPPDESTAIN